MEQYTFDLRVKKFKQEGDIAWEYNPLRNVKTPIGDITDFQIDNSQLKIDLETPIDIECQQSYDGSVNLILNDDKNPPRVINSRMTKLENNRYKIINRNQIKQSNLYEEETIDQTTRLFRNVSTIPKLKLQKVASFGQLEAGNYVFYLKYLDSDYNETDFVAETGVISIFHGDTANPSSCYGAYMDERTDKSIVLYLSNIDTSFTYINLYFSRTSCDINGVKTEKVFKIDRNYEIETKSVIISVTGYEELKELTEEDLNIQYNIVDSVKTQAQVQNRLFFANVNKPVDKNEELQNLSLHIIATQKQVSKEDGIGWVDPLSYATKYGDDLGKSEYYSPLNIYYKLGYFPGEIYRIGIVYIYNDDHLSPVYNLRGCDFNLMASDSDEIKNFAYKGIETLETNDFLDKSNLTNTKGVFRFQKHLNVINYEHQQVEPVGIQFSIATEILDRLKTFNIKGFFFVRQKRIPIFLAQAFSIGVDAVSGVPMLRNGDDYFTESFLDKSRLLVTEYSPRVIHSDNKASSGFLCVDAYVDKQLQSLFNSSDFKISIADKFEDKLNNDIKYYYPKKDKNTDISGKQDLIGDLLYIEQEIPQKIYQDTTFSTKAGMQEELKQVVCFGKEVQDDPNYTNYIRGIYTAFLGSTKSFTDNCVYNVYINNFSESYLEEYFIIRMRDNSPFYAITDRYSINNDPDINSEDISLYEKIYTIPSAINYLFEYDYYKDILEYIKTGVNNKVVGFDEAWLSWGIDAIKENYNSIPSEYTIDQKETLKLIPTTFRGDCFTATVTTRIQRNFTSASVPINDTIIEPDIWRTEFKGARSTENWDHISKADVDAVPIGHWFTYKCLSNKNLSLRSLDPFNTEEVALMGNPRNFYPKYGMSTKSSAKIPESNLYNSGYSTTLGFRRNFAFEIIPYVKDEFDTRIMFSNAQVHGSFKNSYKIFQGLSYQDYDRQYGGITKILPWGVNLLVIFEHAIAIAPVNEKALLQTTEGQNIHMMGAGVLPSQLSIITDMYGSTWKDSIVRTPQALYGVDTYAKKIWKLKEGSGVELISDFKVQRYLHDNINLRELEKTTLLGVRNVKTHYNAYKSDIMFTFYNKDKIWNLCYNELMNLWITRYSWTPLLSENIDNSFFSFDLLKTKIFGTISNNLNKSNELVLNSSWDGEWDQKEDKVLQLGIKQNEYTGFNITKLIVKGYYWDKDRINYDELAKGASDEKDNNFPEIDESFIKVSIYNVLNSDKEDEYEHQHELYENYEKIKGKTHTITFKKQDSSKYIYYTVDLEYIPYLVASYMGTHEEVLNGDELNYTKTDPNQFLVFGSVIKPYSIGLVTSYESVQGGKYENDWNNALLNKIYVHGRANIIDEINYFDRRFDNQCLPTKWYDSQEPFELEFVVNDPRGIHKIFDNLMIISNNVEPQSLEIEIVGDVYDFNKSGIFDYENPIPGHLGEKANAVFPTISLWKDRGEPIEQKYYTKVKWDPILNEYSLLMHQDCVNIKKYNRRIGNIYYNEDRWYTVIQPIFYQDKYEDRLSKVKSIRIRDIYAKIRVKYKGDKLVIITALQTLMTQSYV